jgi:hypothetical protein
MPCRIHQLLALSNPHALGDARQRRLASSVGHIHRSVGCRPQIMMRQAEILFRRRNPHTADDHHRPASRWSNETRRRASFEMKSLSSRRCKENPRFLSQLKKLWCEESKFPVRRVGQTTPTTVRDSHSNQPLGSQADRSAMSATSASRLADGGSMRNEP